jgi:hypothetical protein
MRPPPAARIAGHAACASHNGVRGQAQHLLHRLVLDRFQHLVLDPARVVDQEVDAAVHLQQLLHQRMATGAMVDGTACGLYRQALPQRATLRRMRCGSTPRPSVPAPTSCITTCAPRSASRRL